MTETHTSDTFTTGFQDDDFDLKTRPIFVGLPVPGTEFKICDFETGALAAARRRRRDLLPHAVAAQELLEQAGGDGGSH